MMAFLAPYAGKIIEYLVIISIAGGACLWVKIYYEDIGYQKAIAKITAQDEKATENAKQARDRVDQCRGTWDVTRGVCNP
jgi:hypothetical protein